MKKVQEASLTKTLLQAEYISEVTFNAGTKIVA
jgi:hypothetical protein